MKSRRVITIGHLKALPEKAREVMVDSLGEGDRSLTIWLGLTLCGGGIVWLESNGSPSLLAWQTEVPGVWEVTDDSSFLDRMGFPTREWPNHPGVNELLPHAD